MRTRILIEIQDGWVAYARVRRNLRGWEVANPKVIWQPSTNRESLINDEAGPLDGILPSKELLRKALENVKPHSVWVVFGRQYSVVDQLDVTGISRRKELKTAVALHVDTRLAHLGKKYVWQYKIRRDGRAMQAVWVAVPRDLIEKCSERIESIGWRMEGFCFPELSNWQGWRLKKRQMELPSEKRGQTNTNSLPNAEGFRAYLSIYPTGQAHLTLYRGWRFLGSGMVDLDFQEVANGLANHIAAYCRASKNELPRDSLVVLASGADDQLLKGLQKKLTFHGFDYVKVQCLDGCNGAEKTAWPLMNMYAAWGARRPARSLIQDVRNKQGLSISPARKRTTYLLASVVALTGFTVYMYWRIHSANQELEALSQQQGQWALLESRLTSIESEIDHIELGLSVIAAQREARQRMSEALFVVMQALPEEAEVLEWRFEGLEGLITLRTRSVGDILRALEIPRVKGLELRTRIEPVSTRSGWEQVTLSFKWVDEASRSSSLMSVAKTEG